MATVYPILITLSFSHNCMHFICKFGTRIYRKLNFACFNSFNYAVFFRRVCHTAEILFSLSARSLFQYLVRNRKWWLIVRLNIHLLILNWIGASVIWWLFWWSTIGHESLVVRCEQSDILTLYCSLWLLIKRTNPLLRRLPFEFDEASQAFRTFGFDGLINVHHVVLIFHLLFLNMSLKALIFWRANGVIVHAYHTVLLLCTQLLRLILPKILDRSLTAQI